jgi:hypothetical protein
MSYDACDIEIKIHQSIWLILVHPIWANKLFKQAGAELCQAQVKLKRAIVAVARKKLRAYLF